MSCRGGENMRHATDDDEERGQRQRDREREYEDKTTAVSVATLQRLAESSTEDPADFPARAPDAAPVSPPSFFEKSGAVLVIAEREPKPRGADAEASATETPPASRIVTPIQSEVRARPAALQSASAPARVLQQTSPVPTRPVARRVLALALFALLAFVLGNTLWVNNVAGVRDRVAAQAQAVKAFADWGKALLSK